MNAPQSPPRLPWLAAGEDFPHVSQAWGAADPAPGLLAGGGDLTVSTLKNAYSLGIFPWYSAGQPTLWWSPDPRMVLRVNDFKFHRSLRKALAAFLAAPSGEIRINHDFAAVISACAKARREGQNGTWILPEMQAAYTALHQAGHAFSVETWMQGRLVGGLYGTVVGRAVFGESMFAFETNASKFALCALVSICRGQGVKFIDCQQNTPHLASLGATEIPRNEFCAQVGESALEKQLIWPTKLDEQSVEWKLLDARLNPLSVH